MRQVECTNCGGPDEVSLIVSGIALAFAAASLYFTWRSHRRAEQEHAVFLRQIGARPSIEIGIELEGRNVGPDGVLRVSATSTYLNLRVTLTNSGDVAARDVVCDVMTHRGVADFRWNPPIGDLYAGPMNVDEPFVIDDRRFDACSLRRELEQVPVSAPTVLALRFSVSGDQIAPIRVRVASDDLPERQVERERVFRAQRA